MIDLRSDTVTKPSIEMRKAMAEAIVGDDIFGEDPTVIILQEKVASLLGKEAGLFVPSGVMSNQIAIKVSTSPGDEIICEEESHIFNYETSAPAVLSAVQIKTIRGNFGIMKLEQIKDAIRPNVYYMPKSSLICLENTHNRGGGSIYPIEEIARISNFANKNKINFHLDGARLWNASIATNISLAEYAKYFDSVSVCFSKGLGAPIGSMILGKKDFIDKAKKWRKVFGGGMRQVGILAAASLYAVENNFEKLSDDHEKAKIFAKIISNSKKIKIQNEKVETNIILIDITETGKSVEENISILKSSGVLLSVGTKKTMRAVFHLDVNEDETKTAAEIIERIYK
ncbi:MAG: GntG family PLP-dependent aldolase [Bacteroidota bacterium]